MTIIFDDWIDFSGTLFFQLTDNGSLFVVNLLYEDLCINLDVKQITTTVYHSKTIDKIKRSTKIFVTRWATS